MTYRAELLQNLTAAQQIVRMRTADEWLEYLT